jgi:hypothetical protein
MNEPDHVPAAGSVVLDLAAGIGALILHAPAAMDGHDIEISPNGTGGRRTHACVRPRQVEGCAEYAAVYPGLPAGDYTIWRDPVTPAATVTIAGSHITRCHWPA